MIKVFVLLALYTMSLSQEALKDIKDNPTFEEYQDFIKRYNKSYHSIDEMGQRYNVFMANLNSTKKNSTFGVTKFSDLTQEEFKNKYLKLNATSLTSLDKTKNWFNETRAKKNLRFLQEGGVPSAWDWRDHGIVNEIQNQGSCGGCWAFATVANLEGIYAKKYGYLPKFSEQQLIDCDPSNTGCDGGIMASAYDYLMGSGIQSANTYPYLEYTGYCSYDSNHANNIISDSVSAGTTDEEFIKEMLYTTGPLAITINANLLQYYTGGVLSVSYDECPYAPSHGVNLVGYGTDQNGVDYWTIRNTWGPDWGENGYFRLARGYGLCGVNMYVMSAVLN